MSNTQISQSIDFTFYYYCYYVFIYADEWLYNSIFKKRESYHNVHACATTDGNAAALLMNLGSNVMNTCYSVSGMGSSTISSV